MTSPRRQPSLKCRLAAALCALTDGEGKRLIPHEHAKAMSADQVLRIFVWDHYPIRHCDGGPLEHWNLEPRLIMEHREKTAKVDAPQIAKNREVRTTELIHQAKLASRSGDYTRAAELLASAPKQSRFRPKQKIPSRPFPKVKRGFGQR